MKKFLSCLLALLMTASLLAGCGQQKADDNNGGRCFCTDLWNKADTASAAAKHFGNAENRRYHTAHHHFDRSLRILTASGNPDKAA